MEGEGAPTTAEQAAESTAEGPAAVAAGEASGAAPVEHTEAASDDDLDLDEDDDGDAPSAAAPTATTDRSAASDDDDGDGDLDLDDSEEEAAQEQVAVKKKRKRSNMFIEDSADESDDEGGNAAAEDEEEGDDDNQYKIDGFVVDQDDDDDDDDGAGSKDASDGKESEEDEEDEETRMARKRKQEEREVREAEDMVSELKELARDQDIEIETQSRKRLKKRADAAGDQDLDQELDGVIDKDADQDDDDALDEEEAQQSIQAEYRHEHADMFDMSEYDQMPDIDDEDESAEQAEALDDEEVGGAVDDDDEVDEKYKHIDKADLADNFMTKTDKEIEYADIPERLNLHMRGQHRPLLSGEPLTNDELEEEAQWILSRAFDSRRDLDAGTVANVLRHALVDKEDLPHILRYRKPSMRGDAMPLNESDLWKILRWDARWDHFSHRHKKLLAAAAKLGDELDDDYLQMLKESQKDEHLTDMEIFLRLQTQMQDAGTAQGPKGAVAKAQAAGLGKLVEQSGLSAFQFGVNVSVDMKKNDVVDSEKMPEELAQDFVCDLYPDVDSVLRGSCNMLARQIADEPHVRRHVRGLYRANMYISTKPTARGIDNISVTDRLNGIRHIRKLINELRGQEFLLILEAEKARLIDVVLESADPNWRSILQQECEDFFLSDRENAVAEKWNDWRKIALTKAIENMLLPAMQHELRAELEFDARERLCDSYRQRFTKRIMRGPYSHRGAGLPELVNDDEYDRGIKVLACVWDRDMKVNKDPTPVTCVLLSREGEHRETLELPFMQLSDFDRRKQDSCKLLTEFVKRHKPDVVCVGTNGRTSESLYQIVDMVVKNVHEIRMAPPVFIDDAPARIYQQSKRAVEELPDQNTLVKLAISVGRLAHDPLGEMANLLCDPKDFEQLVVHPLQDMLDISERMKIADECMVDAVNAFGVDINVACRNKHSSALLRYVSGLGPRKAKSIFDVVSAFPQPIESRSAMVNQKLVGMAVYTSCAGFIRVDHGRLQTDVDYRSDIELLDNTMIHPSLEGYEYGKKMATDALDAEPQGEDDYEEVRHKCVVSIMRDPSALDELDLDEYAKQLESAGTHFNVGRMLQEIKKELQTKWWERKLPWKKLEDAELFQAIAGFHGRDIFVGECEPAYYEGEIDARAAYVPLDCQLRARLQASSLEFEVQQLEDEKKFRFGEPLFYMMTKCTFDTRRSQDDGLEMPPRFMIDVTRSESSNDYGDPGLQSSIEYECGILCDMFALTRQNVDKSKQNAGRNIKQRQIQHPDFQNVTFNGARRYLEGTGSGSDFVIRPSSQGTDHLSITIQFFEDIYLNVDIEERNTTARTIASCTSLSAAVLATAILSCVQLDRVYPQQRVCRACRTIAG